MRNVFLEKLYRIRGGETILRLISKKSKLRISLDLEFHTGSFYYMPS